ncbi:MaoC family dehydratase [Microvirga sp. Marseille-Q2068]|uniref:MaoC family dehydratase n=1 Tax=Microvirga mediterraneensis TaxID=2754695 RepID=A0A838BKM1_9HYPH|nr:MaoC family dehydratase [Microvirga mediterraneensis]MBA1156018.1 MaoC family dehydratase [Microvirga mediterraneensis]
MSPEDYRLGTLERFVGHDFGVSDWVLIDQDRIERFAACTGDSQWIHVEAERARRESPFGGTIAHGNLIVSMLPRFAYDLGVVPRDAGIVINYGADRIRFTAPVRSGSRIRSRIVLLAAEARGEDRVLATARYTVEIEGADRPALVADILTLFAAR